jgi:glycosyltransferase involved in cell wall biosynthesis
MDRVVIYRRDLLPISETFVRDQASALESWRPVLLGLSEVQDGLATPGIPRAIVHIAPGRSLTTLRLCTGKPVPRLVRRLMELDVALVHAHFGLDATDIWPSVKAAGLPMLVTLHGYDINTYRDWWEAGRGGFLRRPYPRRLLRMAQEPAVHFVAVSQAVGQRAVEYGVPADKITVCYIGVDTRKFEPGGSPTGDRPRCILFIGRMVEKKAPLLMVRAFAEVRKRVSDAELVMIGDGPLLEDTKHLAGELNTPVSFLGARDSDEVLAQLRQARVLCLPSVTASNGDAEGFGLVLLEAQACGVPVVSSARGGAAEGIIDGKTGFRFAEGKEDELVDRLQKVLSDEETHAAMALAAPEFVRKSFDIAVCTRNLEEIYDRHGL